MGRNNPIIETQFMFGPCLGQTFANPFYGLNSVYPRTITRANLLTPYPQFGAITQTENVGFSHYHALQAQLTKRFSHNYSVNLAYTFSKLMDGLTFLNNTDRGRDVFVYFNNDGGGNAVRNALTLKSMVEA